MIRKLSYSFILFLFIYAVPFKTIPLNSGKLSLIFVFLFLLFISTFRAISIPREVKRLFLIFSPLLILGIFLSTIRAMLTDSFQFDLAYSFTITLLESLFGVLVFIVLAYNLKMGEKDVIKSLIGVMVFQALIILVSMNFEMLRELIFSVSRFEDSHRGIYNRYGGFRGLGLSGQVTYDLSVNLSLSVMLIGYLIFKSNQLDILVNWYVVIIITVLMTSVISVTGRTGLIGIIMALFLYLFYFISISFTKKLIHLMIITVLLIAFIGLISIDLDSRLLNRIYDYVFEFYINSVSDGGVSTESTTLLWQMITTPMSSETMLYGDGYWLDTESNKFYYKNVDSGYIRHILFYGMPLTLIIFTVFVCQFLYISLYKVNLNYITLLFLSLLVMYFLIAEIKGDFIFGSGMNMKVLYIIVFSIYLKSKREALA